MARSRSISADYQPSKRQAQAVESSPELEEPVEDRSGLPLFLPALDATPKDGPRSSSRPVNGSSKVGKSRPTTSGPSGSASSGGPRRSLRSPQKQFGRNASPLFLDASSPENPPGHSRANGRRSSPPPRRTSPRKVAQPPPSRSLGKPPSWASINDSGPSTRASPTKDSRGEKHVADGGGEKEDEEVEQVEYRREEGPDPSVVSRELESEAGPSMSRIPSKSSRMSSDPLALRGHEVDQLEGTDARDPIEILDDSQSASGSESVFEPTRIKRKRVQAPFVDNFDSGSSRAASKGKGKAKAVDPSPSSSKSNVIVELPVLPLAVLKKYYLPHEYKRFRPDYISRLHLPRAGPSKVAKKYVPPDERRNTFKERLKARGLSTLDPDGSFADVMESDGSVHWKESDAEDDDEEDDGEMYSDSESDPIALRRSRRTGYKAPERHRPKTRASRAMDKLAGNRAFSRLTTSSISEESFYGTSARRSKLPRHMRPPTRSARRRARPDSDSEDETPRRRQDDDLESEDGSRKKTNGWAVESEGEEEMDVDSGSVYGEDGDELDETTEDEGRESGDDALRRHRAFCEKCGRMPANEILAKAIARKKKPGKRRKRNEDEMSDEEWANQMEGWLECEKCVISSHWGCLAATQQKDVLLSLAEKEGPPKPGERRRKSVRIDERSEFVCARCTAHPKCFVCHNEHIEPAREGANGDVVPESAKASNANGPSASAGGQDDDASGRMDVHQPREEHKPDPAVEQGDSEAENALLFRCHRCRLACHYVHLNDRPADQLAPNSSLAQKAEWYQSTDREWTCHQCRDWIWPVDIICAWRPSPIDAVESPGEDDEPPSYRDPLPREYLVKWDKRGFRHVSWIPHAWALATTAQKLRHFLEKGPSLDLVTDETLAARGDDMAHPTIAIVSAEDDTVQGHRASHSHQPGHKAEWKGYGPPPDVDAQNSIPQEWCTIDRVLDVMLVPPKTKKKAAKPGKGHRILSASASPAPEGTESHAIAVNDVDGHRNGPRRPDGVEPPEEERMDIDTWEEMSGRTLGPDDVDEVAGMVTWCFVKWDDLQYDQSTWDTPPPIDSTLYPAFKRALKRYLGARLVHVPVLTSAEAKQRDLAAQTMRQPPEEQPECIVGGTLMPFQMQGFQWLLYKHFKRESCILADDMGLGKTIQIASLVGYLGSSELQVYPCLVVVPNSTITNWVREFEKWVPHMRVVPYYGEASSRKIISKYELYRKGQQGKAAGLRAHVVLTTYDMITGSEFRVFGGVPRWEVLCVDEGQRLKSDGSLIFNRLKTLNSVHRILLTGTPLNNNLRELFNLLNFLDRETFKELADLESRFEDLNEAKVTELHEMIKPYILRRIKADVLKLPPKIEIIVPISLAPLQKNVYKTILERNAGLLKAIAEAKERRKKKGIKAAPEKPNETNAPVAAAPAPAAVPAGTETEHVAATAEKADGVEKERPTEAQAVAEPIVVD